jgi:hypothetical protein
MRTRPSLSSVAVWKCRGAGHEPVRLKVEEKRSVGVVEGNGRRSRPAEGSGLRVIQLRRSRGIVALSSGDEDPTVEE